MSSSGAEIANAYVALYVKAPGMKKELDKMVGASGATDVGRKIGDRISKTLKTTVKVGAVAAGAAIATIGIAGFKAAKQIETSRKVLSGLYGDTKLATETLKDLRAVGRDSPIDYSAYAKAAESLAYAGVTGKDATGILENVGKAITAAGGDSTNLDRASDALLKGVNAGRFQLDTLQQLSNAGIPILSGLAEHYGVSMAELNKMASAGQVGLEDVMAVMQNATGDTFQQMLKAGDKASESFENVWKKAKDNVIVSVGELMVPALEKLAPILDDVQKHVVDFIDGMRDGEGPGGRFVQIVKDIWDNTSGFISTVTGAVTATTDWVQRNKDWLQSLAVAAGVITGVVTAVKTFRAIQLGITAATYGAQGAMLVAGGSAKVYGAIMSTQAGVTKVVTVAQKAFNTALRSNPIGIAVTAIAALVAGLIWFFTKTETGQAIWEKFTTFLGEAWENIKGFFQAAWQNVIEPVLSGIGEKFTWLWENILSPIFNAFQVASAIFQGVLVGLYEVAVKPVLDWIGEKFSWLWNTVIKVVVDLVVGYIKVWAAIFTWLWENAVKPAIDAIGAALTWIWENVVSPVVDWIKEKITLWGLVIQYLWTEYVKPALDKISAKFREIWENVVRPVVDWIREKLNIMGLGFQIAWQMVRDAWDNIKNKIQTGWNAIKSVIDTLVSVIKSDPKEAFEAARDAIGKAWDGIKDKAKDPVRFVIQTVINDGLIDTLNKLPMKNKIPRVPLPRGFSEGGHTGNLPVNAVAGVVHGNEHVIRASSRAAIERSNPGLLDYINENGKLPGYKKGGMVHPLPGGRITTYWMGYPGHKGMDFAKPQGSPIYAAAAGAVNHAAYYGGWGNMVKIDHGQGLQTLYAHIMPGGFNVKVGDFVKAGQTIARVGTTGFSTGPHLHYEVWKNGTAVNPLPYVTGAAGHDGGAYGAMLNLSSWAAEKFKKAFPNGGMWADVASGVMKEAVSSVVDWGKDKLSIGGATLYDNGGWLPTGTSLVQNNTRSPEPILTGSQWDAVKSGRQGDVYVQNPFTGEYLLAKVDDRAAKVTLEGLSGASQTALRMG